MSALLALLGVLCLLVGFVLFVIGGFRVSVLWGLIVLFLPTVLSFAAGFIGAATDLVNASWWIWFAILLSFLPWFAFMALHWEKAKNGFLMYFAGMVFFAAAVISIDADTKQKLAAGALAYAAKSGQPLPPAISDWLGIKKPAVAGINPARRERPTPSRMPRELRRASQPPMHRRDRSPAHRAGSKRRPWCSRPWRNSTIAPPS